jgi:hypothetical protein
VRTDRRIDQPVRSSMSLPMASAANTTVRCALTDKSQVRQRRSSDISFEGRTITNQKQRLAAHHR